MTEVLSPVSCKVNNVFIHVTDLKRAAEWYSKLLGLPAPKQVESPVYNLPVTGDTGLTLDNHAFDPAFVFSPSKHPVFNFLVTDVDETYRFMKDNNITIVREIERIGEVAFFNFEDEDGNVLMICNC
ncbi:VOC family protein [Fictibacillus fluitans]|uniref:VOC family protein n=1 Tax=Fictibacillus fluitans TaxID=3058422 RepID=A0ABT8HW82_9BACL|nr:VOC family protein [Fictibacillus sp. NE201]MDN4525006.1 VOC family protein [Fictibacillus sp. NE201]